MSKAWRNEQRDVVADLSSERAYVCFASSFKTPEHTKARRSVARMLSPYIGASAARDAADALGGSPFDIAWNGTNLAEAISYAFNIRETSARHRELAAEFTGKMVHWLDREAAWREKDAAALTDAEHRDTIAEGIGVCRGAAFMNAERAAEHEADARAVLVLP